MAAEPERRYRTCVEFARAVELAVSDTERWPHRWGLSGLVRRPRGRIAALGAIAVVVVAAVMTAVWPTPHRSDGATPSTASQTSAAKTGLLRCYWRVRVPIGTDFYLELPSGAADHDDLRCALNDGDRGDSVLALRQALTMCHGIELDATTVYDTPMKRAIRHLQVDHGAAVDGIYGPETRAKPSSGRYFGSPTVPSTADAYRCHDTRCRYAGGCAHRYGHSGNGSGRCCGPDRGSWVRQWRVGQ